MFSRNNRTKHPREELHRRLNRQAYKLHWNPFAQTRTVYYPVDPGRPENYLWEPLETKVKPIGDTGFYCLARANDSVWIGRTRESDGAIYADYVYGLDKEKATQLLAILK